MSRERKYRAWDEAAEVFILSDQIAGGMWRFWKTLEDRGIRHFEADDWTGLKNIYESDTVQLQEQWIDKKTEEVVEETTYDLEVCFVNYRWELIHFRINENGIRMPTLILSLHDFHDYSFGFCFEKYNRDFHCKTRYTAPEVIGNIHVTPKGEE